MDPMRQLIILLVKKGANEDLIEAAVSILETEENFLKMIEEITPVENPSRTYLLGEALLIADP